jgi:hypothetical protein
MSVAVAVIECLALVTDWRKLLRAVRHGLIKWPHQEFRNRRKPLVTDPNKNEESEPKATEVDGLEILRAIKQLIDEKARHLRTRNRTLWRVQKASLWLVCFAVIISQKLGWTSWIKRLEQSEAQKAQERERMEREYREFQILKLGLLRAEAETAERKRRDRPAGRQRRRKSRKR